MVYNWFKNWLMNRTSEEGKFHGYKGNSNFIVFVMKILKAHYFQN